MKRFISITLALLTCLTSTALISGCDNKPDTQNTSSVASSKTDDKKTDGDKTTSSNTDAKELDYKNMTAEQLVDKFITDKKNIKLEEYTALLETYSNVGITDELELEQSITFDAIQLLRDEEDVEFPPAVKIFNALIVSESPQVRGIAMGYSGSLFGVSDADIKVFKEAIKNEKEPFVLKKAVSALANEGKKDPDIGKFLVDMSKNENPYVRRQSAYALGNTWSIGVDGAVDAMLTMMNDKEQIVREAAYKYIGKLHDESVIDELTKILNNNDEVALHDEALESLLTMWFDYPFHKYTSEKAYKATMDYYKNCPRNEKTPPWIAISSLQHIAESSFPDWKVKATYYNSQEIIDLMKEFIADENIDWLARNAAVSVVATHGTKDDLKAMESMVNGLTDSKAKYIQQTYEKELNKK